MAKAITTNNDVYVNFFTEVAPYIFPYIKTRRYYLEIPNFTMGLPTGGDPFASQTVTFPEVDVLGNPLEDTLYNYGTNTTSQMTPDFKLSSIPIATRAVSLVFNPQNLAQLRLAYDRVNGNSSLAIELIQQSSNPQVSNADPYGVAVFANNMADIMTLAVNNVERSINRDLFLGNTQIDGFTGLFNNPNITNTIAGGAISNPQELYALLAEAYVYGKNQSNGAYETDTFIIPNNLYPIAIQPYSLSSGTGPTGLTVLDWAERQGIKLFFIPPGILGLPLSGAMSGNILAMNQQTARFSFVLPPTVQGVQERDLNYIIPIQIRYSAVYFQAPVVNTYISFNIT